MFQNEPKTTKIKHGKFAAKLQSQGTLQPSALGIWKMQHLSIKMETHRCLMNESMLTFQPSTYY